MDRHRRESIRWLALALALLQADAGTRASANQAYAAARLLPLPRPRLRGEMAVEQALQQRRSVRRFSAVPLTLAQVGQLLWAAQGITHPQGLRTAPSAGALYPLEAYLLAAHVDGLTNGLYRYVPAQHALAALAESAEADPLAVLATAAPGQDWLLGAAAVLLLAGVVARATPRYGARAQRYLHIETGHAAQNVHLQATALGLATVLVGAFDDDRLRADLDLPDGHLPMVLMPLGHGR